MYKSKGLKNISIQKVKDYFIENKYATKNQIAEDTHLSHATITNILKELLENQFIVRVEDCESTGGRKAKQYKICGSYMVFGLIDLRVQNQTVSIECRIVDLDFVIIENMKCQFDTLNLNVFTNLIQDIKEKHHIQYLGISIPAIVTNGKIEKSDIESLDGVELQKHIETVCGIHTMIENDVNTVMLGYIHTHVIESQSIAFVYQPDNHHSGCGLYINGSLLYGATHFAGELAYLPNGTLKEQEDILKKDPLSLLIKQAASIIAIMNPSLMILYTPCVETEIFKATIKKYIPVQHLPEFQFINEMETYIFEGLASLCIESSRYKRK